MTLSRICALLFAALVASAITASRAVPSLLPYASVSGAVNVSLTDVSSVVFGVRRLGADIAWIQLLQYYGSPEKPLNKDQEFRLSWDMTRYLFGFRAEEREVPFSGGEYDPPIEGGIYPDLLSYCYRVTALDPFHYYVYLYGGGALAWNLGRPQEALALLQHGIGLMDGYRSDLTRDVHQPYWQLNLYASAIVYRQAGDFSGMVTTLETAARQPRAPNMIKGILANIYQKQGNYAASARLWREIADSDDLSYRSRAAKKLLELNRYL